MIWGKEDKVVQWIKQGCTMEVVQWIKTCCSFSLGQC